MEKGCGTRILYLEAYYGGSHRQMVDLLQQEFGGELYTLPPSKWNWRMRISALHFSDTIPRDKEYDVLFATSVLNLCELVALRPDLAKLHKLYYFHENQLVYPVRKQQERDFQHGYNQILSCLVADKIIFNSYYNMDTFLSSIQSFLSVIPDHRPKLLSERIAPKCSVLYFPVEVMAHRHQLMVKKSEGVSRTELHGKGGDVGESAASVDEVASCACVISPQPSLSDEVLHILWPHRWEHDKGPQEFCFVLMKLIDDQLPFCVSILGSYTNDVPDCLREIIPLLGARLLHKGRIPQHQYEAVLNTAHVVVSTAKHEFFGVAMLEAVFCGCYPLCPNRLVYPEIYPSECLYNTEQQLFKRLRYFCQQPSTARDASIDLLISSERFLWNHLNKLYRKLFDNT